MKKNSMKFLFPYMLLAILILVIGYFYTFKDYKVNELSYNEFMTYLSNEQVEKLEITPKSKESTYYVTGKLEDYDKNETFELILPYTDSVVEKVLDEVNKQQLDVVINKEPSNVWLSVILEFVPIILIAGLTIYMVRAMMGNGKEEL